MFSKKKGAGKAKAPRRKAPPPIPAAPDAKMVGVWFPVAYLKVIGAEAARFGVGRGQFLTMLVKRKAGEILMDRPPNAPKHEATPDELSRTQKYVWAMHPQIRNQIDAARLRMGNISLGNYLMLLINEWLGQPDGLTLGPDFDLNEVPTNRG